MATTLHDGIEFWFMATATPLVAVLAVEIGFRLGKRRGILLEKETSVSGLVQATLGLLAFMLAFTFGIAESHYQERKELVLAEANSVGTVFLRSGFIAEAQQNEIRVLLKEYVESRLDVRGHPNKIHQAIARSNQLLDQLWQHALTVGSEDTTSVVNALFISSLNDLIDTSAKRVKARLRARISPFIWTSLYILLILSMASMGYQTGLSGARLLYVYSSLIISFSVVMYLIYDLDQPQEGIINVSQQDMEILHNTILTSLRK